MRRASFPSLTALLVIALATFGVYFNALDNGFVFDDFQLLVEDPRVKLPPRDWHILLGFDGSGPGYRPLRTISYALDYQLGGLHPFIFHLSNIVYHVLASFLVFLIVLRLSSHRWPAVVCALLFSLHPIQTDSVTYISGRRDVLSGLFFFLSFFFFLQGRSSHSLPRASRFFWLFLALLAFFCGLFTKEMAITLPLLFFTHDAFAEYRHHPERGWRRGTCNALRTHRIFYGVLLFLAAVFLTYFLFFLPLRPSKQLTWWGGTPFTNFLTVARVWIHYLKLLFLPVTLIGDYSYDAFPVTHSPGDIGSWASAATLIMLTYSAYWAARRCHLLFSFCGVWFGITLLPVSHVIPHHELLAEHYLYIPSFGFCLFLALLFQNLLEKRSRRVIYGLLAALLAFYAVRTMLRNRDWQDDLTFYTKTVKDAPRCVRARLGLGAAHDLRGTPLFALPQYQEALRLDPDNVKVHVNLARDYGLLEMVELAENHYQRAYALDPRNVGLLRAMGVFYIQRKDLGKAQQYLEAAAGERPDIADTWRKLAWIYRQQGDVQAALNCLGKAQQLQPGDQDIARQIRELS